LNSKVNLFPYSDIESGNPSYITLPDGISTVNLQMQVYAIFINLYDTLDAYLHQGMLFSVPT